MANYKVTQEQFDKLMEAAEALDKQGVVSYCGNHCKYRGPNGTKCFVGHLISDEIYEESMEDKCLVHLLRKGVVEGFDDSDLKLLHLFQLHHDAPGLFSWETDRKTNPNAMQDYVKETVKVV